MPKYTVDFKDVANSLDHRRLKFEDVKHQFVRVAFDIYKRQDSGFDELWRVESGNDGDYIVALYDESDKIATASEQPWHVLVKNAELHVYYKRDPLCKIAGSQLGFQTNDLELAQRYLPTRLAGNPTLVRHLLNTVDSDVRKSILSKYPELA